MSKRETPAEELSRLTDAVCGVVRPPPTETPDAYELAIAIAPHLADNWTAVRPATEAGYSRSMVAYLHREKDSARLFLHLYGARLEIQGTWPCFANGHAYERKGRYAIAVGANRDSKRLAREIERRLLPDWDKAYAEALAYVTARDAERAKAKACAERIAKEIGADAPFERAGTFHVRTGLVYDLRVVPERDSPSIHFRVDNVDEMRTVAILNMLTADLAESMKAEAPADLQRNAGRESTCRMSRPIKGEET